MAERQAAIVGVYEHPLRMAPGRSAMQLKVESIHGALADAGLSLSDVDAVYDASEAEGGAGLGLSAYLGIKPRLIDTTAVGGSDRKSTRLNSSHRT